MIVAKNALCLSLCRLAADLSSLVLFILVSRHLGPIATGEYSYAFALGVFISILAAAGLDQYGVRQYSQLHSAIDQRNCWRGMLAAQTIQLLFGTALLALVVGAWSGAGANPLVVLELAFFLICWALSRTLFVPATAREAMARPAVIEFACRTAASLSASVLCLLGVRSLPAMLIGFPVAGVAFVVAALRNAALNGARFELTSSWAEIRSIIRDAAPFTACEALAQFYIRADLLLIVQLLGPASAGWYAADLKLVEVGVTPLLLLGTAAYPLLSRTAFQAPGFVRLSEEFLRSILFVSGWLAVGMYCLLPMLIPALFGNRFEPAVGLLPMFALLAVAKGLELGLCRLLYATKRQNTYLGAMVLGTVLIVVLNLVLIPQFGMAGAIGAVVASSVLVDLVAIVRLRSDLRPRVLAVSLARLAIPLGVTAIVFTALDATSLNDWYVALIACVAFPALGFATGLMPNPRRSVLFA